jgi:hypothetical protein
VGLGQEWWVEDWAEVVGIGVQSGSKNDLLRNAPDSTEYFV